MSIITRILKGFPLTWNEVDQNFTDLDTLKAPKASPTFTGIVSGITKAMIGLGNADDKSSATIRSEITSSNVTTALGFTPENAANKGVANGYAGLDGSGKVSSGQLPSYVDDVLEYPTFASLPTTGESGKIYILDASYTLNGKTSDQFRWSGSAYIPVIASPGTTDAVAEGTVNLFFTNARAKSALNGMYLPIEGGKLTGSLNFLDGTTQTTAATASMGFGFKNRMINGDMRIDQRNAGASISVSSNTGTQFVVDRFIVQGTTAAGVFSAQQLSATPPDGFNNYSRITVTTADASPASGSLYLLSQIIEGFNIADLGFGTANAATVTFSFRVRSSLTGTFSGSLKNGNAYNRSYPFTYSISSANTWETKTVTVTGDLTGTWQSGNLGGLIVNWDLGCGSSLLSSANSWQGANYNGVTGSTRLISTNGATLDITGVQLEVGSTATSFDVRDYGRELIMCQRYYEIIDYVAIVLGSGGYSNSYSNSVSYKTTKRVAPTVTTYPSANLSGTAGNALLSASSTNTSVSVSILQNNIFAFSIQYSGSSAYSFGQLSAAVTAEL